MKNSICIVHDALDCWNYLRGYVPAKLRFGNHGNHGNALRNYHSSQLTQLSNGSSPYEYHS